MNSLNGVDSRRDILEDRINGFEVSPIEKSVKKIKKKPRVGENIHKSHI